MPKLTKTTVEGLSSDSDCIIFDEELPRFAVRVKRSGSKSYLIQYRNAAGQTRRLTLGQHGVLTADEARRRARKLLGRVDNGEDPSAQRHADREAPTVAELAELLLGVHAPQRQLRESYLRDVRSCLERYILPALRTKKVAQVAPSDIRRIHLMLRDRPSQANRTLAILSKMFALAVQDGMRPDNPCRGIKKYADQKRDRWLSDDELRRLVDALARHPNQTAANAVHMLLQTGARLSEVLKATWDMFDLERGVWTKPSHHTKQKRTEHLPLSAQTIALLTDMKARNDGASRFLFPSETGDKPRYGVRRFWSAIKRDAGLENVRLHDLRHTHASHLVSAGLSLAIVGRLLGHTQPATTMRYAHLADDPLRAAANRFGAKLAVLSEEQAGADLVGLRPKNG